MSVARNTLRLALALLAAHVPAEVVAAETYPNRPVRLIVPFAAGGGADIVARVRAFMMKEIASWKRVVEKGNIKLD